MFFCVQLNFQPQPVTSRLGEAEREQLPERSPLKIEAVHRYALRVGSIYERNATRERYNPRHRSHLSRRIIRFARLLGFLAAASYPASRRRRRPS